MNAKKWICILLAAVLFLQAAPLTALADPALTETELAAALALAGSRSPEVGDHSGNTSLENMTALQLGDEVDDMLDIDVKTLETSCEDIEYALYTLQQKDPAKYKELTSGDAAGYPDQIHDIFRQTEDLRRQLEIWQDTLVSQSSTIIRNAEAIQQPNVSDYDTRFFNHQTRQATDDIRNIRQAISEQSGTYQTWLTAQLNLLAAEDGIGGWAKKVLMVEDPKVYHQTVSVSGRFQTRNTLLDRLSPISTAVADQDQKASLRVQDNKSIAICTKLGENKFLQGAMVIVKDTRNTASYMGTTGNDGCFNVPISGLQLENDEVAISVSISATGYRTFIADMVYLKKGGYYEVTMVKDDGQPYVAGCSFAEHECLLSEYTALYNSKNELPVPVRVHLVNPSETKCQVFLVYQSIDGQQYYRSMEVQGEAGKSDKYYVPAHGEGTLEITAPWRQKWKPGGAKFTWTHGEKTTTETDNKLLQMVISTSSVVKTDFTKGSPDLDAAGLNKVVSSQLKAEASKVEEPIVSANMLSSFYSGINSVFNFSFDMSGGKVFKTGQVGLDLPFAYLLPRVSVARDGSTTIVLGTDLGDFQKDKGPLLKNKDKLDSEEIKKTLNYAYKDLNAFTKKVATGAFHQANAEREGGVKVGNIKSTITPIAGLVYRIEHDGNTWTSKNLTGILGVVLSLDATFSETQIFPPCPVPVCFGATFSFSASFYGEFRGTVAVNSKAKLDEQLITKCGFNPNFSGLTIQIKAMVTVYAGIGIKGLFSATVNGYGYLSFLFELKGTHFTHLRISAGFGFYLLLEVVFWHAKFSIWDSPDYTLWDDEWPKASVSGQPQFSSIFSSSGQAEDGDAPESPPLTAQDYPDLVPSSTKVAGISGAMSSEVQLLEIGGETFAFYIGEKVALNGTNRVVWLNLATGKTGTFEGTLRAAENRQSFVSDPQNTLQNRTLIDQLDKLYAGENAGIYSTDDINFTVGQVEMDDSETLIRGVYGGLYTLTALAADIAQVSDTEIELRSQPRMYILGFTSDGNHGLTTDLPVPSYYVDYTKGPNPKIEFIANPFMTWRMLFSAALQGEKDDLKDTVLQLISSGSVASTTKDGDGYLNQIYHYATLSIGDQVASMTEFMPLTLAVNGLPKADSKESALRGAYGCQLDLRQHDGENVQVGIAPPSYEAANTYYYLQDSGKQDEKQLNYHSIYPSDLQKDVNVVFYRVYGEADADHVFSLSPETLPNGQTLYHMHGAKIQHISAHVCPVYTFTNFDITVTGAYFSIQRVSDTVYVYWTEQHQKKDDKNTLIYYLKAVAYDPKTGIASDDFVLAQFTAPSDQNIKQILLTDQDKGYYVGNDGIYSFPFRLVAAMDLDAAVLDHDVVGIGENDTVLVRMVNNGSLAISHFTLTESAVQQDGSLQLVETVTCDTQKPENSVLHLEGDDASLDIHGEKAIQRQRINLGKDTQSYWETKQTVRTFTSRTAYTDKEQEVDLEASEILPGQVAAFTMLMETPKSWKESKTWQLQFDLTKYSAVSNLQRSLALEHGLLDAEDTDAPQTLTWTRTAAGTMELENAALLNASGGPVYAAELPAPDSVAVDVSVNNLVVDHRVYVTPDGERRVSMTIHNDANLFGSIRISCEVRVDDSDTPFYLDLPYDPDSLAANRTHTIDFPVSALSGGKKDAKKAEVTVRGIDIEEWILLDNSFTVELGDGDPLRIIVQPQSQTVNAGDSVKLFVQAAGGVPPYQYQWQEYAEEGQGWRDIAGAADSELTLTPGKDVSWYRCIVTDLNQDSVLSDTAEITLRKVVPRTGDSSHDLPYLLAGTALLALWFLLRRPKRRSKN